MALILAMNVCAPALATGDMPDKPQAASISLGSEFASGNYGTDSTIRSLYMPLIATWFPNDRIDIGIEIPFIYQSDSNVTTELFRTNQSTTAAKTSLRGGPGGNSIRNSQQSGNVSATATGLSTGRSSSAAPDSNVSGLGDIILRLGVIALFEDTNIPQIRPSLFVKCPTASTSDGLGTGEFDMGAGIEVSKWYGDMHLTGEGFYTYQGKAEGFNLNNYFSFTAGVGYQITKSVEPMFIVKGATAPSSYSSGLLETRARVIWSLTKVTSLDLYFSRGIADSSPDYGGGIAVVYAF